MSTGDFPKQLNGVWIEISTLLPDVGFVCSISLLAHYSLALSSWFTFCNGRTGSDRLGVGCAGARDGGIFFYASIHGRYGKMGE